MCASKKMYVRVDENGYPLAIHHVPGEIPFHHTRAIPVVVEEDAVFHNLFGYNYDMLNIAVDPKKGAKAFRGKEDSVSFVEKNQSYKRGFCPIYGQRLFSVQVPFVCWVSEGPKGFSARLNLHPDLDGPNTSRFYFVDKSVEGRRAGFMLVTSIKEKNSYGFLCGEMLTATAPQSDQIAEYLRHQLKDYRYGDIVSYFSDGGDSFTVLYNNSHNQRCVIADSDGRVYTVVNMPDSSQSYAGCRTCSTSVQDFVLACRHYSSNLTSLKHRVYTSSLAQFAGNPVHKPGSEAISVACNLGFLQFLRVFGIDYAEFKWDLVLEAVNHFEETELFSLFTEVNTFNRIADGKFKSLVKKGRISTELLTSNLACNI